MANQAGQQLSDDEVREFGAYTKAGLPLPEKFEGVVFENTTGQAFYRYPTEEERKASTETAAAIEKAQTDDATLMAKVRAEAAKRTAAAVEPPPRPESVATNVAAERSR